MFFFLTAAPPSYDSLFGRVREVRKSSNGFVDFIKNLFFYLLGKSISLYIYSYIVTSYLLYIPILNSWIIGYDYGYDYFAYLYAGYWIIILL